MPSQRAWNNVMFAGTQRCIMLWLIPSRSGQNIFIWGEKNNSSRCWAQSLNGEVGRCFQVPRHLRASACINVWTVSLHTACAFWDSPEIPSWSNRKHRQNWHACNPLYNQQLQSWKILKLKLLVFMISSDNVGKKTIIEKMKNIYIWCNIF